MEPTQELIDSIYRERVLRARAMPLGEKLLTGVQLFDEACQWMEVGIRSRFPEADDEEVRRILIEQVNRLRRVEEAEWKTPNTLAR